MEPIWMQEVPRMSTTLTLKNVPDDVYERLKAAAEANRRSLNGQAIVCLEAALTLEEATPSARLTRARELRARLGTTRQFKAREINAFKREGRS
jgi:plasmid stability protein